jgi:recombination protein RecR
MEIPSKYLSKAVEEIASLPGIGKKSALRIALHLLRQPAKETEQLSKSLMELVTIAKSCIICHNVSDEEICPICADSRRNKAQICVVEDIRDVMAIESTGTYSGVYHVLGGLISPMEGISPADLNISTLLKKLEESTVSEIIFALSPTLEGDTTNFYLFKKLQSFGVFVSTLSRGIAVGSELHYADELTLGRSLQHRQPFSLQQK